MDDTDFLDKLTYISFPGRFIFMRKIYKLDRKDEHKHKVHFGVMEDYMI